MTQIKHIRCNHINADVLMHVFYIFKTVFHIAFDLTIK